MLSSKQSLSEQKTISYILRKGRFASGKYVRARITENRYGDFRYVIILSKKVCKTAVARNLLKRRLKHIIHKNNIDKIPINTAILPNNIAKNAPFIELEEDFVSLFLPFESSSC